MNGSAATPWADLLGGDPTPWLLSCDEPAAVWLTMTGVLRRTAQDAAVRRARADVLADPATRELVGRLPSWEGGERVTGHDSPAFAPNLLLLLADMGVGPGDVAEVDAVLAAMTAHQEADGRFTSLGAVRAGVPPVWGSLPCDNHGVTEALVRFGHGDDPRVLAALACMARDLAETAQGPAWRCLPHTTLRWRGPGRVGDFCPMVTVQALRTFARVPPERRPAALLDTARTALRAWRVRGNEAPYMFGHGRRFKAVKWPPTWYGALALLDAVAGYPALWRADGPAGAQRRAVVELLACLVAYNVGESGAVTPRSVRRGFEAHSFGQKRRPSAFATARVLATLAAFDDLAAEVAEVDVTVLTSSRGGAGTALPPRR